MKAIVRAADYIFGDERKGKQWAKLVNGVDYRLQNGYAIQGDFLPKHSQIELEVGSIILSVGFVGSWKNGKLAAHIYRVQPKGAPLLMYEYYDYFDSIVEIRNVIGDLLQYKVPDSEKLAEFSTEALQAEIERRKNVQFDDYNIIFSDDQDSSDKGFSQTLDYCRNYIKTYAGTNESYFADYKGGVVSIVNNKTGQVVESYSVDNGKLIHKIAK